ncbi:MAG TPA: ADP-ribosylglycohydrolase family protein [Candidatus Sulfotelmatobacter sp.]|nr:ADP-ribosylglycohydrolase family protein [Candidatus Sulfotelmatobacter sp.]
MKTILILEDNEDRIAGFERAVAELGDGFELKIWRDAPSMIAECEQYFSSVALISLDHDLNPQPGATTDPGTGMDLAEFLADFLSVCPVLIHSSNTNCAYSMLNKLRFAGWTVDRVGPLGVEWIGITWLKRMRQLMEQCPNCWKVNLPSDHAVRVERIRLSLDGLGIGDALGEMLSYRWATAPEWIAQNDFPSGPWFHTDDTEMAISIAAVLKSYGEINQDALARRFARRFERDPDRGYGSMTRIQMRQICDGAQWKNTSANAFGGQGSMGNGSAMRVAPLGAYFADDIERCVKEARDSSVVTHTHPEGVAGAIAVAVAAAMAWQLKNMTANERSLRFFDEILRLTPDSRVRQGILHASQTPFSVPGENVAKTLGNGSLVTAPDTVPFCIWAAANHLGDFREALSQTICVGGDCDTNAAIVGGIVALCAGRDSIPQEWLNAREELKI